MDTPTRAGESRSRLRLVWSQPLQPEPSAPVIARNTMTKQEREAFDAMYRALRNLPCRCAHNVPYSGCKVERAVSQECARCVAMRLADGLQLEKAS